MEGLSPATYCIQETAVPAGYVLDNTVHKFTVDANGLVKNEQGYTMVIENRYIKAEFLKTDKVTGEAVAGAVMQLTDKSGKVIDTWTSGKTAHRINKLPAGRICTYRNNSSFRLQKRKTGDLYGKKYIWSSEVPDDRCEDGDSYNKQNSSWR